MTHSPGQFLLFLTVLLLPQEILTPIADSVAAGVAILGMSPDSQRAFTSELTKRGQISNKKPGEGTVDARFDDKKRPRCYGGVQFTDKGGDYFDAAGQRRMGDADSESDDGTNSEDTNLGDY